MTKDFKDLKVAIVHDWIFKIGGAEKCVETLCEMFPNADFYSLFGDIKNIKKYAPAIANRKITFSKLNRLPFIKKYYRYTYPLWPMIIENFDLHGYDLVITSSGCVAKGVITDINTPHVCYMFSPMRYAWDQTKEYFNPENFSWWKRFVIPFFLHYIRIWDVTSTDRIDYLISNSSFIARGIKKYYRRDVDKVIFPPVYTDKAVWDKPKEDYYLSISPFEPNKGGRLMIETAINNDWNIRIIGEGSMKKELMNMAKGHNNIQFLGYVSEEEKWDLLSKAKAFLFTGTEDFGISPLEAIASGTPVVAFKKGGALDYIVDGVTGTFFEKQTEKALERAVKRIDEYNKKNMFNPKSMNSYIGNNFSKERFVKEFTDVFRNMLKAG